jgi:hypothetical protein
MTGAASDCSQAKGALALRNVQLAMLATQSRQHPFYWASFIPIGARGPIEFSEGATVDPMRTGGGSQRRDLRGQLEGGG